MVQERLDLSPPSLPPPPKICSEANSMRIVDSEIIDERNDYPVSFSVSRTLETCRQYLLLRTVILQKKKSSGAAELSVSLR